MRGLLSVGCALALAACGSTAADGPTFAAGAGSSAAPSTVPDGDWPTFDYTPQRTGVGPASTGISARDLRQLRRRTVELDGTVDSSPIQLHAVNVSGRVRDVVILTTSYGRTIALDPSNGRKLWEFTPQAIGRYQGSPQITHSTPVADPNRRYVYAASPDGLIHKLSVTTGRQAWVTSITFDPTKEKIGPALNISGPYVVAATGGYDGDAPVYQGHVVLIGRSSGRIVRVWNSLCSDRHRLIDPPSSCHASDSAIWSRAGVVVEPRSGRLLFATGNGPFNGHTNWGDSVLELSPTAAGLLHNWTPTDQAQLNATDGDVGSSSPALLPGGLAVQGGKSRVLWLLNLARLNGTTGGASPRLGGQLQEIQSPGSDIVFTAPAVWTHAGRTYLFVADFSATWAYRLGRDRRLHVAWRDSFPGTSPVVAGGLLYVYDPDGRMDVIRPGTGHVLASLPAANGHWNSPIVVGGRIILPVGNANDHRTTGTLFIYHLPGR